MAERNTAARRPSDLTRLSSSLRPPDTIDDRSVPVGLPDFGSARRAGRGYVAGPGGKGPLPVEPAPHSSPRARRERNLPIDQVARDVLRIAEQRVAVATATLPVQVEHRRRSRPRSPRSRPEFLFARRGIERGGAGTKSATWRRTWRRGRLMRSRCCRDIRPAIAVGCSEGLARTTPRRGRRVGGLPLRHDGDRYDEPPRWRAGGRPSRVLLPPHRVSADGRTQFISDVGIRPIGLLGQAAGGPVRPRSARAT